MTRTSLVVGSRIALAAAVWWGGARAIASPPATSQTPPPTLGEIVDPDAPAIYRLPAVPIDAAPAVSPAATAAADALPTAPTSPAPSSEVVVAVPHDGSSARDQNRASPPADSPADAPATTAAPQTAATAPPAGEDDDTPPIAEKSTPPSAAKPLATEPSVQAGATHTAVPSADSPRASSPRVAPPALPPLGTTTELSLQVLPAVQRGYALAQRGAMYAARAEFVLVLRRIAQAKDAAANCDAHSKALAAGLRAIDEAEDFVPDGVQVEAELDVRLVASSHRTPVLDGVATSVSPHEAAAQYHGYAQQQLAAAVGGEQAGSMALYGLGKVSATLAQRTGGDAALSRAALTMYSASLAACPANHLAANELGVLLVRQGRLDEAARLFERAIDLAPNATAYHNLAAAQAKLGFVGQAVANEQESQRLATLERARGVVSRRAGIEWVPPDELAGVAQPALSPVAPVPPRRKSPWQKTKELARSLPFVGGSMTR